MDNLAVTSSVFGTSDIVSSGTEFYPHASQAQIANNTGYNYYHPVLVASFDGVITGTEVHKAYLQEGTYEIYTACIVADCAGALNTCFVTIDPVTTGIFILDGTDGWHYQNKGNGGTTNWAGTTGWYSVSFIANGTSSMDDAQVWFRQISN